MESVSLFYMGVFVPATILLPISCAVKNYRFIGRELKIIFLYLVVAGITNVIAAVLAFSNRNNLFVLHLYSAIEFSIISIYFFHLFKQVFLKRIIFLTVIAYIGYCLFNALYLQRIDHFNTYTRSVQAVIISAYSLYYLYAGIGNFLGSQRKDSHYWVQIGLIIYFMSSLIQFSFSNHVSQHLEKEIKLWIWNFHATMVMLMYLFFSKAYIINNK